MQYLILSILSSSSLMIIFKYFDKFRIHTFDAIVINYLVAGVLSLLLDSSGIPFEETPAQPWFWNAVIIGILFISLFNVIAVSTQKIGVSVTTVANKMSLIIPVIFTVIVLGDTINFIKILGIILAFVAVYFTTKTENRQDIDRRFAMFPLIVFIASGFIDTFFKYNETFTLGDKGLQPFLSWIFITSLIAGVLTLIYRYIKIRQLPQSRAILGGIALGIPNYFSVFFLLKSLSIKSLQSSVVFPVNNMSIVAVSALAGIFLFKEKITTINKIGISLCLVSIALIAFSEQILNLF
ncbi:MAG: EamA family transporter [Bacteroidetes bacterium]|nr:EamA family transporter [Bacteroidota bacterium]